MRSLTSQLTIQFEAYPNLDFEKKTQKWRTTTKGENSKGPEPFEGCGYGP